MVKLKRIQCACWTDSNDLGVTQMEIFYHPTLLQRILRQPATSKTFIEYGQTWFRRDTFERADHRENWDIGSATIWLNSN